MLREKFTPPSLAIGNCDATPLKEKWVAMGGKFSCTDFEQRDEHFNMEDVNSHEGNFQSITFI